MVRTIRDETDTKRPSGFVSHNWCSGCPRALFLISKKQ